MKKKGKVIWITGLPGSGKTAIAKKITKQITLLYGPTIEISGDELRKIFKFNDYNIKSRVKYAQIYSRFCKNLSNKGINIIFSTVSLFHIVQKWNKNNIKEYFEIYIKTDVKKIIKFKKKKIYEKKSNLMGIHLIPQFPKSPDILIENDFSKSVNYLSKSLIKKIKDMKII